MTTNSQVRAIQAILQTTGGTREAWNDTTQVVPEGVYLISLDDGAILQGNGEDLAKDLTPLFYLSQILAMRDQMAQLQDLFGNLSVDLLLQMTGHILHAQGVTDRTVFTPSYRNGKTQSVQFSQSTVTLTAPQLFGSQSTGLCTLYVSSTDSTEVLIDGTTVVEVGTGDGLIVLPGQTYKYELETINSVTYVTTTLLI